MSPFQTWLIGFILVIIGAAAAAWLLGAPPTWIAIGVVILAGLGVLRGVTATKTKQPQPPDYRNRPPGY